MTIRKRLAVGFAGTAAALMAAVVGAAAPAQAHSHGFDCTAEYEILRGGDGGFTAEVTVTNESSTPDLGHWEVTLFYGGTGPELSYTSGDARFYERVSLVIIRGDSPLPRGASTAVTVAGTGLSEPLGGNANANCRDTRYPDL